MKFRKLPVVIEAKLLQPDTVSEIRAWAHEGFAPEMNSIILPNLGGVEVRTKEGYLFAPYGSWIIKGVAGEFYPCDPEIFKKTYEPV